MEDREQDPAAWEATTTRMRFRPDGGSDRRCDGYDVPVLEKTEVGTPFDWKPIITTILLGARDEHSPLVLLRGQEEDVIQRICEFLIYKFKPGAVTLTRPAYSASRVPYFPFEGGADDIDPDDVECIIYGDGDAGRAFNALVQTRYHVETISLLKKDRPQIAFTPCNVVEFPESTGINVNMMPFVMGDRSTLPRELQPYYDSIITKCPIHRDENGEVMFLTVQESFVEAKKTQRRPGLHIEAPAASVHHQINGEFVAGLEHRWGMGIAFSPDERKGGLYIASNMNNTTAIWDALVDHKLGAVDTHGGIEHLRPHIGEGKKLPANLLVWLTDHTPHEALPQKEDGNRQFFRLVTGDVSVWFAAHSTPNPKVPVPSHIKVIGESKFSSLNGNTTRNYTENDFSDSASESLDLDRDDDDSMDTKDYDEPPKSSPPTSPRALQRWLFDDSSDESSTD